MSDFGWKFKVWWWRLFPPNAGAIATTMQMEGYTELEIDYELWGFTKMHASDMKQLLLTAPAGQLDACMKPLIEKRDTPAKAVQILEVLDSCIHGGLASGFTVRLLQMLYDAALTTEKTTHETVVKLAIWRV
jgi:hypothetical protein